MNKILQSVYSDSTRQFVSNPYPRRKESITIAIRIKKNNLYKIFLKYKRLGVEIVEEMKESRELNGLFYYEYTLICYDEELSYQFYILGENKLYYYTQKGISDYLHDDSTNFKILINYDAPSWLAKSVFYQIMPDRFCIGDSEKIIEDKYTYNGNKPIIMNWDDKPLPYSKTNAMDFYGGDLWGIITKLDYLQKLGVNAIYLNPIFKSPTYHKYDALDYFEIDPSLGGDDALIALTKEIHKRGMRIILDISINHTSSSSKWFNKTNEFYPDGTGAYNNVKSQEREYYFFQDNNTYLSWFGVETMPQLNYSSAKLRDIIYRDEDSVIKKYLKEPYNIDGWRFDVADVMARNEEVDLYHEVWKEIYREIKKTKKDAAIIAEEWTDAWQMYDGTQWDTTMNYFQVARPLREFAGAKDLLLDRTPEFSNLPNQMDALKLEKRILHFKNKIPEQIQYQMFNLIDSHDVPRLYHENNVELTSFIGAVITLFGLPGATSIWYGDEILLSGHSRNHEGTRYPMNWSGKLTKKQKETQKIFKQLATLKTNKSSLQEGSFKILREYIDIFSFVRFTDEEMYIFIWSEAKKKRRLIIDLDNYGMQTKEGKTVLGNIKIKQEKEKLEIKIPEKESGIISLT